MLKIDLPLFIDIYKTKKRMNKINAQINEQGQIVDDNGVPIKDHKGEIIVVPLEYRYNYQEYQKKRLVYG